MNIPFNRPLYIGTELAVVQSVVADNKLNSSEYIEFCEKWLEEKTCTEKALLTTSCTHALELAAILANIGPGDEVIMPSYTFPSSANAFVLRGATPIFVDIKPDTCNIDESLIEDAITKRTRAIVSVHYAGIACDMDAIMGLAKKYGLIVIEDAAQCMMATWRGKHLGTIGHFGTLSFHSSKNYTSGGQGGALLINDREFYSSAEIIRDKGTNRSAYIRGEVKQYTWLDKGSNYLPSAIQAAFLSVQFLHAANVNERRISLWDEYYKAFNELHEKRAITIPKIGSDRIHNGHMFFLIMPSPEHRTSLIEHLYKNNIASATHYIPLHTSPAGKKYGRFNGVDNYTSHISERIVRLPLYFEMTQLEQRYIINNALPYINDFAKKL